MPTTPHLAPQLVFIAQILLDRLRLVGVPHEVGGLLDIGESFIDRIAILHVSRVGTLPPVNPFLTAPSSLQSAPSTRGPITPEKHPVQGSVGIEVVHDMDEGTGVRRSSKMFDFRKPAWIRESSSALPACYA